MTGVVHAQGVYALVLSMVAGIPLLLAPFCGTPLKKFIFKALPLAAVPALAASFFVPSDLIVEVPWFFMSGNMGLDKTGRIFLVATSFIWLMAALSGRESLVDDPKKYRFAGFFLTAMAGNLGLILAQDMLGYYLFFAMMSFSSFGLIIHNGTRESRRAGRIYLIFILIGEVALFVALVALAVRADGLLIKEITGESISLEVLVFLFIGFGVKIGAVPFFGWMLAAYQAAPVKAATALAGATVNAGLLGWLRFVPLGEVVSFSGALIFITAGCIGALLGIFIGFTRKGGGTILACSSISQMGLMTVVFGLGLTGFDAGRQAVFALTLYAVHHALAKSSLFLGYGVLKKNGSSPAKWQVAAIFIPALSLAGMPLTSGAFAKAAFKDIFLLVGGPWAALSVYFLPAAAIGTTMLLLHFISVVKQGASSGRKSCKMDLYVWYISLIVVCLAIWFWPEARFYAGSSFEASRIWQAVWPIIAGVLLFFGWYRFAAPAKNTFQKAVVKISDKDFSSYSICSLVQTLSGKVDSGAVLFRKTKEKTEKKLSKKLELSIINLFLRKAEKVSGRWMAAGFSYLFLCCLLLFLLRRALFSSL